jgi:hypothetical protein
MRKAIIIIWLVALVLGVTGIIRADTVECNLFSLGCPTGFDINSPYWQTDFDLGVTFSEISHVYIDWSGAITAALLQSVDPRTYEPIGEPGPIDVGVYASLRYPRRTTVWAGGATYPNPEPFDCLSEFELLGNTTWSDLLDGQGTITVDYTEYIVLYGNYVEHGSIDLDSATLMVDGTIVPEPASILLLIIGALGLRSKYLSRQLKQ